MQKGSITANNVHNACRFLLNLDIHTIDAKYKQDALVLSHALTEAWQDYHRPHSSSSNSGKEVIETIDHVLLTLINAATTLAATLTSETKQQLMKHLAQNTTTHSGA